MDANTDGKPYGVDIVMPAKVPTEGTSRRHQQADPADAPRLRREDPRRPRCARRCPRTRRRNEGVLGWLHSVARCHVEVALKHPIKLIANALGSPPKDVIDQAHAAGVPVAALAGSAKHALRHVENGVDIVVAQGHEAGGHTGEIGSMVLWPEIVDALDGKAPVLAAGGIGTGTPGGRGAGARCAGRVDGLGVPDLGRVRPRPCGRPVGRVDDPAGACSTPTSSDTVRRKIYTGKPARLLKSRWTDAWDADGRTGAAADAAAEHPGQRGPSADERVRRSDHRRDAGRSDRGPDERDPARSPTSSASWSSGFEAATKRLDGIAGS